MQIDAKLVSTVISDLGNGYRNSALLAGYLAHGFAVTCLVEAVAKRMFNLTNNFLPILIGFAAGTTASSYLAPHSSLVKSPANRFSDLSILSIALVLGMCATREQTKPKHRSYLMLASGLALLAGAGLIAGRCGHRSLVAAEAFGTIVLLYCDS